MLGQHVLHKPKQIFARRVDIRQFGFRVQRNLRPGPGEARDRGLELRICVDIQVHHQPRRRSLHIVVHIHLKHGHQHVKTKQRGQLLKGYVVSVHEHLRAKVHLSNEVISDSLLLLQRDGLLGQQLGVLSGLVAFGGYHGYQLLVQLFHRHRQFAKQTQWRVVNAISGPRE